MALVNRIRGKTGPPVRERMAANCSLLSVYLLKKANSFAPMCDCLRDRPLPGKKSWLFCAPVSRLYNEGGRESMALQIAKTAKRAGYPVGSYSVIAVQPFLHRTGRGRSNDVFVWLDPRDGLT